MLAHLVLWASSIPTATTEVFMITKELIILKDRRPQIKRLSANDSKVAQQLKDEKLSVRAQSKIT